MQMACPPPCGLALSQVRVHTGTAGAHWLPAPQPRPWGALQNLAWPCWLPARWVRGCERRPEGRAFFTPLLGAPRAQCGVFARLGSVRELSSQDKWAGVGSGPSGLGLPAVAVEGRGDGCGPDGPGQPWRTAGRTVACRRWELGGPVGQPGVPEDGWAGQGGSGGGREPWRWMGQAGGPQAWPESKGGGSKPVGCAGTAGQQGRLRESWSLALGLSGQGDEGQDRPEAPGVGWAEP